MLFDKTTSYRAENVYNGKKLISSFAPFPPNKRKKISNHLKITPKKKTKGEKQQQQKNKRFKEKLDSSALVKFESSSEAFIKVDLYRFARQNSARISLLKGNTSLKSF